MAFGVAVLCALEGMIAFAGPTALACEPGLRFDGAAMQRYIGEWYEWFDVDGIFIDEGSKYTGNYLPDGTYDTAARDYYFGIRDYVRNTVTRSTGTVRGRGTILNASGLQRYPEIFDAADMVLVSEYNCDEFLTKPFVQPAWFANVSRSKTLMVATQCSVAQLDPIVALLSDTAHHAGHMYVTSGTQSDYGHLPSYWAEEKASVAQAAADIVFPLFGLSPDVRTAATAVPTASIVVLDFGMGCTSDYVQGKLANNATLKSYVQAAQQSGLKVYGYVTSRFACDPAVAPRGPDCPREIVDSPAFVPVTINGRIVFIPAGI